MNDVLIAPDPKLIIQAADSNDMKILLVEDDPKQLMPLQTV
jgi:hypothetical protein